MYISDSCPPRMLGFQGKCYVLSHDQKGWDAARTVCKSLGSNYDLAIIDNSDLNKVLWGFANDHYGTVYDWWIGAQDKKKEGTFHWVDGSLLTFSNWWNGEPNNHEVIELYIGFSIITLFVNIIPDFSFILVLFVYYKQGDQDCAALEGAWKGKWDDKTCNEKRNYICEARGNIICCIRTGRKI